ncbi:MAG: calcium/sodium antiporter [Acidobacteria bacterium]|mgnify:CR=1 FL=1|nr:calcium/sodium antiporter [Acidobacteriota bacterium]
MTLSAFLFLALGLAFLVGGAELLVRGASRLAFRFGISPLVVGLTVVAFGTSAPELAVSIQAGLAGQSALAIGNIVGSNIFNVLVVLGLSALITPLAVRQQLIRLDVPLLCGLSVTFWLMALDGRIGMVEGLLLVGGVIAYTVWAIREGRREAKGVQDEYAREFGAPARAHWTGRLPVQLGLVAAGLALLVLGAQWLVDGAVLIARGLNVSEVVIGLTIVAAGTSLPELVTSAVAAFHGERDIAVGNVIGSCLFNILAVAGFASLVTSGGLIVSDTLIRFDLLVMVAVALACLPIFSTGQTISRWEGGTFVLYYGAYVTYLVLSATGNEALSVFSWVVFGVVLPVTIVTWLWFWRTTRVATSAPPVDPGSQAP